MRIGIHQTNLLLRLPVLSKLACCDATVALDSVQFSKGDWQNRCMLADLRNRHHKVIATLAVKTSGRLKQRIADVELFGGKYSPSRIRGLLETFYHQSRFFIEIDQLSKSLKDEPSLLVQAAAPTVAAALLSVGRDPPLNLPEIDDHVRQIGPTDRIIAICKSLGATEYLCGQSALSYIDRDAFEASGIALLVHRWSPVLDKKADHRLSYLDFVARHGIEALMQEVRNHGGASVFSA